MRTIRDLIAGQKPTHAAQEELTACLFCSADLTASATYKKHRVCGSCHYHYTLPANRRIALLVDDDTFHELDHTLTWLDPLSFSGRVRYRDRLEEARQQGPRSLHPSLGPDAGSGLGPASGCQRATSDKGT